MSTAPLAVVRTYKGTQAQAAKDFQSEAAHLAPQGYVPTSQVWAPGSYGCGSFVLAALLCFVLVGVIVFIYMLIVKPPGVLTVTYQRVDAAPLSPPPLPCR